MRYASYFLVFISLFSIVSGEEKQLPHLAFGSGPSGVMSDPPEKKVKQKEEIDETDFPPGPVLTGPLLTPSANTIPEGYFNIEPYLFVTTTTGNYGNNWHFEKVSPRPQSINIIVITQIGLNSFMDFEFAPQFYLNSVEDIDIWRFGDLVIGIDIQLLSEDNTRGIPALKFSVDEIIPTGTYQHLKASNLGTDIGGRGTYVTIFSLVTSYLWTFKDPHFLAARMSVSYEVATNVSVHGVNAFGGDPTTKGRVYPGDLFQIVAGFEYTLTKCWAFAFDIEANFADRNKFRGCTCIPVGRCDNAVQFSMAPAIEFNHNPSFGIIGGVWFSFAGKNSPAFVSGVFAVNIYV